MADVEGVQTAKVTARGNRAPGTQDGRVHVLSDSYTFPANAFSASDTIKIGSLPAGARVIGAGIHIAASLGTTGIFDLGTDDDPNGFVSGADAGGQAAIKKGSTEALIGHQFTAETDVVLDCTEVTDAAVDLEIFAWVEYVMQSME